MPRGGRGLRLVASVAGGGCIDDADCCAPGGRPAPWAARSRRMGTFLRSFRWGHVRQDRVSRELLARAWAGRGGTRRRAADQPRFHHLRDLRTGQGGRTPPRLYRQAGLSPAVGHRRRHRRMSRLREGRANTARGAAHSCVKRWGGCARRGQRATHGARRQRLLYPRRGRRLAGWMSASPSPSASTKACGT